MNQQTHWETIYQTKPADAVSWYSPHLTTSLRLIKQMADPQAAIIDVGAGESTLTDDLLARGHRDLSVLDISPAALAVTQHRLGTQASRVTWLTGDITQVQLPAARFDVWHDRAVFHFLTTAAQRSRYVQQVQRAVKAGGHLVVATFGPQGPSQCSGLEVRRYDAVTLQREFGAAFKLLEHSTELHHTPSGSTQQWLYCLFRLQAAATES